MLLVCVGTHFCELLFPLCSGKGYSSRASGLNQSDLLLSGGSVGQLPIGGGGGGVYLPDYSVRQLTDLQVLKVTKINPHATYVELCELVSLHIQRKVYLNTFPLKKWRLHHSKIPAFNLGIPGLFLCCGLCLWYALIPDSDWTQASGLSLAPEVSLTPLKTHDNNLRLNPEYFILGCHVWSLAPAHVGGTCAFVCVSRRCPCFYRSPGVTTKTPWRPPGWTAAPRPRTRWTPTSKGGRPSRRPARTASPSRSHTRTPEWGWPASHTSIPTVAFATPTSWTRGTASFVSRVDLCKLFASNVLLLNDCEYSNEPH